MKALRLAVVAALALAAGWISAQEAGVNSEWVNGNLKFFDASTKSAVFYINKGTGGISATSASVSGTLTAGTVSGAATLSSARILGGQIDAVTIGGSTPGPVYATALGATSLALNGTTVTATGTEINKLAGVTAGTATASKAAVLGASKDINELVIGSATIQNGTIDGAAIGATTASTAAFTNVTATYIAPGNCALTSGTMDGIAIGASTPAAGTFTALTATSLVVNGLTLLVTSATVANGNASEIWSLAGVTSNSVVCASLSTDLTTATLKSAVPGNGTVTVTLSEGADADCRVSLMIWK